MANESYIVDADKRFQRALKKASDQVDDLRVPFKLITRSWFKSNRSFFILKSAGLFEDLAESTKKQKTRLLGSPYPILRGITGNLEKSITNPSDSGSVNLIVNKKTLILGTQVQSKKGAPYPFFLQDGTSKMPARPFIIIGGEQTSTAPINRRREAWIKLISDYVFKVSKKNFGK